MAHLDESCRDACKTQHPGAAAELDRLVADVTDHCGVDCPGSPVQTSAAISGWGLCGCGPNRSDTIAPATWIEATAKCNAAICADGVSLTLHATIRSPDLAKHYWLLRDTTVHQEVAYGSGGAVDGGANDVYTIDLAFNGKIEPGHAYDLISVTWLDGVGICSARTPAARVSLGPLSHTTNLSIDASANVAGACTLADFW